MVMKFSLVLSFFLLWTIEAQSGLKCVDLFRKKSSSVVNLNHGEIESSFTISSFDVSSNNQNAKADVKKNEIIFRNKGSDAAEFSIALSLSEDATFGWEFLPYKSNGRRAKVLKPDMVSIQENLEKSFFDYRKGQLFVGMAMMPSRSLFVDQKKVIGKTNLNFLAQGSEKIKIFLRSDLTERLSQLTGKNIQYEFEIMPPQNLDWVSVRLADFKLNDPDLELKYDFIRTAQNISEFGISLSRGLSRPESQFKMGKTVYLGLDIQNHELDKFIDNLFLNHESHFYFERFGDRPSDFELKVILKKFFREMQKSHNQEYAVGVVRNGLNAIKSVYARYGWSINTNFTGKVSMLEIVESIEKRDLFFEAGDFGPLHGSFAHHAQILSGFQGLTAAEAKIVSEFIAHYIADNGRSTQWPLWSAFFDSRGYGVTSNRYWRDLINKN